MCLSLDVCQCMCLSFDCASVYVFVFRLCVIVCVYNFVCVHVRLSVDLRSCFFKLLFLFF